MLALFLSFLSFLESVVGFVLLSSSLVKIKEPKRRNMAHGVIELLLGIVFSLYVYYRMDIHSAEAMIVPIYVVVMTLWFVICSGDKMFVSVFVLLTQFNFYLAINCISFTLTNDLQGLKYLIAFFCIRAVIYATLIPLLFKFVRPAFRVLVAGLDKEWKLMSLIPLTFLVLQIFLLYYPTMYWYREAYNGNMIVTTYVLFIVVYYVIALQAYGIMKKHALEERELLMAQQNKLWEAELLSQKESIKAAGRKQHDLRHHTAVIMDLLVNKDLDGLWNYMKDYNRSLDEYLSITYCSNPTINSILNAYSQRAINESIAVNIQAIVPAEIGIDSIDLTCMFANAIENAIEGCMRLPQEVKRHIYVEAKYIDNRLRIQVENTCADNIEFDEGMPITQKQEGGTGTKSILYITEKYDGMAGFSVKEGEFYTNIVLNAIKK